MEAVPTTKQKKPVPPSGEKLSSSAFAVQSAKIQKAKKKEEESKKKSGPSFVTKHRNRFSHALLTSNRGKLLIDQVEQQGEFGVDLAESVRTRAEAHKRFENSKMDAGEKSRLEMEKITSRFNMGLPVSDLG